MLIIGASTRSVDFAAYYSVDRQTAHKVFPILFVRNNCARKDVVYAILNFTVDLTKPANPQCKRAQLFAILAALRENSLPALRYRRTAGR